MISKEKYEFALGKVEELLPLVDGYDQSGKEAAELANFVSPLASLRPPCWESYNTEIYFRYSPQIILA